MSKNHPSSLDHTVRFARPERKKKLTVKFELTETLYKDASILCELSDEEIAQILRDDGLCGLGNYVANQENWK